MAAETTGRIGPQELMQRVEWLSAELQQLGDPHAKQVAEELSACILELHGVGLERVIDAIADHPEVQQRFTDDKVIESLLMIHGLHPVSIETRVLAGLDQVRPYMESHGGNVELLGIEEGVAKLRLEGSCDGCAASQSTLELAINKALEQTAPDLFGTEVVEGGQQQPEITGTPLPLANGGPAKQPSAFWMELATPDVGVGEIAPLQANGTKLVVANVEGSGLLAYVDRCAACGGELVGGQLSEGVLACPSCDRRFFLPRAGRSLDDERLQLEPIPLLANGGGVKVALPG